MTAHDLSELQTALGPHWDSFRAQVTSTTDADMIAAGFDPNDLPEEWPQWFEGRWAAIGLDPPLVTVYERTGHYCDEWTLEPDGQWSSSESGTELCRGPRGNIR